MKINTDKNCNIVIFDDTEYPINGMEYSKSASLYIAQLNEFNKSTILYNKLDSHTNSTGEPILLTPQKGGFITICHIILPKSDIDTASEGYFTDGTKFYYKNNQGLIKNVETSEIIEVNPEAFGIIKYTQNFFSVCYLRKCYVSLCQKIFNDRGFDRCINNKVNSQLIYKRDLVWAALNVIQYMIDSNQLAEAQRLLERINTCNGLCSSEDTGDKGCGCE